MDTTWFNETLARVGEYPLLQGILAALATFVLEDPTTVGCGLLVADGRMGFWTAYLGVSLGIALGDLGLFAAGRWLGLRVMRWGLVTAPRLGRASRWFKSNMVSAVLVSRFVPGMRLPTYLGAGMLGAPAWKFLGLVVVASFVWTLLLLRLTVALGQAVLPWLGRLKWPVAAAAVLLLVLLQWLAGRRRGQELEGEESEGGESSLFEFWPPALFYIPVAVYYAWLALRFQSLTLPTISNPSIYSGGFIGESKSQILSLVSPDHQGWVAPYLVVRRPLSDEQLAAEAERAAEALERRGIAFPIVAKPDIGQRGAGVRPVRDQEELQQYLLDFPPGRDVILQQLAAGPGEAGVLYCRRPDQERGCIFSITLKHFPTVVGDGRHTLRELILEDSRASLISHVYFNRHRERLDEVIPQGEAVQLVFSGNHCQGAVFKNATDQATPLLAARIHEIAAAMPEFYFGRFDVKFESLELFLSGKSFKIVEINGAGAEATHIWDSKTRLREAYRTLFEQFEILFLIGAENRRRGYRPLGPVRLARALLSYRRLAVSYPMTE